MRTITLPAQVEHLPQWTQFIVDCAQEHGLPSKRIREIELACEEALVNICHYAYPEGAGEVEVTCLAEAQQRFVIELVDRGLPFNPLSLGQPALTDDLADRQVGGLGVFLIRRLMDDVSYRRQDERNILRLTVHRYSTK
jgi:serine/threonine-protein kinase RsbW